MQFKYPEILFALFLLLIPIIIHLFRLRRFQKTEFTNVAFLKEIVLQTRKSSQLKKWLTLLMRLLAFACIILAFSQPYFPSETTVSDSDETLIYIDNSFSMQGKIGNSTLLEQVVKDLYESVKNETTFHWFSNDSEHLNVTAHDFKNEIANLTYSSQSLSANEVLLKADKMFSNRANTTKNLIFISDFSGMDEFPEIPDNIALKAIQVRPQNPSNIAVDTAHVVAKTGDKINLELTLSRQGEAPNQVPVSIYNKDQLVAKSTLEFSDSNQVTSVFELDVSDGFDGYIEVTDAEILYDNLLYISVNKSPKINVLDIYENPVSYTKRLFDDTDFDYTASAIKSLNYAQIPQQHFIVLNELKTIPDALTAALKAFKENGGNIVVIPHRQADMDAYNQLLNALKLGTLSSLVQQEKRITNIVFSHPLFDNVFEQEVTNFQYPSVETYFQLASTATPVLQFEDATPFLVERDGVYLFTASLSIDNSNFINSPLIVPTMYNMGLQSLPLSALYYTIGETNEIMIPETLSENEILKIRKNQEEFIPLQQTKSTHVVLTTNDLPEKAGIYEVVRNGNVLKSLSYNYARSENVINYANPNHWEGAEVYDDIPKLLSAIYHDDTTNGLWKWFVIFAVLFLISEMLILKFLK